MARTAKVYLAGAGLGDPGLLTGKALRLLEQAGAIIYDRLVSAEILALANPDATFIYAGKRQGQQEEVQAEIFDWFLRLAASARVIVRLKSGDPMVFGCGGEELAFLAGDGIDAEIVPAISFVLTGPGLAWVPVTHRGVAASFSFIAGHRPSPTSLDWSVYRGVDTLVILMGVEHRDVIAHTSLGRVTVEAPAVIVIGEVVRHRTRLHRDLLEGVAA